MHFPQTKDGRGFSLVELVTVIVLVGVLLAVVLPRSFDTATFSKEAAVDQALSGLRYAQQQAMSRSVQARFDYGESQYVVEYLDPDTGNWESASPRSPWDLPGGVSFEPPGSTVTFDGLGTAACSGTKEIGIEGAGQITVHCATGFAHAS